MSGSLPSIESFVRDTQTPQTTASPSHPRYTSVAVLCVYWCDDEAINSVREAVADMTRLLERDFQYTVETLEIPIGFAAGVTPARWLDEVTMNFVKSHEERDCLKVFYYNGYTYLSNAGEQKDMILAKSLPHVHNEGFTAANFRPDYAEAHRSIRWSPIQARFETTASDMLILFDAPYHQPRHIDRTNGVLEVLAATSTGDHFHALGRNKFTMAITSLLRNRFIRPYQNPFRIGNLHADVATKYFSVVTPDFNRPQRPHLDDFPAPVFYQFGSDRIASITLAPIRRSPPPSQHGQDAPTYLEIRLEGGDGLIRKDLLDEWLRLAPWKVSEAKVEGPRGNFAYTLRR
jgi:hypothetical protein